MKRPFTDRSDAAHRLTSVLRETPMTSPIVLGVPRGGAVVSTSVARNLGAEHSVVVARKLRAPTQPELAIGAGTANGSLCLDEEFAILSGAGPHDLSTARERQIAEARPQLRRPMLRRLPTGGGRGDDIVRDPRTIAREIEEEKNGQLVSAVEARN
ncbi:MAG TPA: hypothetical protein VNE17_08370 [Nitrolancea sp.]|nr:hypothetical protein [Nitrolancea sp.]